MRVISSLETALTPTAIALGNFDGLHRGHQRVIQPILDFANTRQSVQPILSKASLSLEELSGTNTSYCLPESEPTYATVVTFNPHPQEFFSGQPRKLLTPVEEKVKCLESLGIEQLVLLPFNQELASLSPEEFVEGILVQKLNAQCISVGADFRFGLGRKGTTAYLQAIAAKYGIGVNIVPLQTCEGERISSSLIRQSLEQGDLRAANRLLGRSYTITGTVVTGKKLGRTIGFPTANLHFPPRKFLPKSGVYCVQVFLEEEKSTSSPLLGVMNIGCRPTVDGSHTTVEVHLLDWSGDLYGQKLTVSLEEFLRPEQKFPNLDALKAQIHADCEHAKKLLMVSSLD